MANEKILDRSQKISDRSQNNSAHLNTTKFESQHIQQSILDVNMLNNGDANLSNSETVTSPDNSEQTETDGQESTSSSIDDDSDSKKSKLNRLIMRKKRNAKLAKILTPKSALMVLHELKPGISFSISWPSSQGPMQAQAVFEGEVVGQGEGKSKCAAKNAAAEDALKKLITNSMDDVRKKVEAVDANGCEEEEVADGELSSREMEIQKLPWANMASYALYRLFNEWQEEGIEVPIFSKSFHNVLANGEVTNFTVKPASELPANAQNMHPVSLLNELYPGIQVEEINRTSYPHSSVTVGYRVDGMLYTGTATNKKTARKEAAKRVCSALYQLTFS